MKPWVLAACLWGVALGLPAQELSRIAATWEPVGERDSWWAASTQTPGLMQPFELLCLQFWRDGEDPSPAPEVPADCVGETSSSERAAHGGTLRTTRMQLRPGRHGRLQLGPQLEVFVPSVLPEGPEREVTEAPADLTPPPAPPSRWWWALLAVPLLALLFLLLRPRGRRGMGDAVPLPPHTEALRALQRLAQQPRETPAQVEQFYLQVSGILRRYLELRFGLPASRRTSEEFLAELEADARLPEAQRHSLANFLRHCDLVKFGAWQPGPEIHAETLRIAEAVVEASRADVFAVEVGPR